GSPGMRTSRSATSTRRERMISRPLAPSAASRTSKSSFKMKRSESRTPGSSSMTRTTGRGGYVTGGNETAAVAALSFGFGNGEDDIFVAASATLEIDGNDLAWLDGRHDPPEALHILDRLPIDLENCISGADSRLIPGAAGRHVGDDHTRTGREFGALGR